MRHVVILAALFLLVAACRAPAAPDAKRVSQWVQPAVQTALPSQLGPTPVSISEASTAAIASIASRARPTATPTPTTAPTERPTATLSLVPTHKSAPAYTPTVVLSPASTAGPSILTDRAANLRAGPGAEYPIIGVSQPGHTYAVQGKTDDSAWFEVCCVDQHSAWVSASVVKTAVDIASVKVAKDIPTPPATPTPAPAPTQPPTPTVPAVMPYMVKSVRLRAVHEGLQTCTAGDHTIIATIVDSAGRPIDGVHVHEVWTNTTHVTGERGPGVVEWATWKNGGGKLQIVDDNGQPLSPATREMSNAWPDVDLMMAAGYCACESLDETACAAALQSHSKYFTFGHYVYEVVFQRTS